MASLRDQLRKAKLLSDKEARRLAHEERVRRKARGREELEAEENARQRELEALREEERERARRAQEERDRRRDLEAERAACLEILAREAFRPRPGGSMRWYFQLEDGRLPWLEVDAHEKRELQSGAWAVVVAGPPGAHVYALLPTALARRVARVLPEKIAWAVRGVRSS